MDLYRDLAPGEWFRAQQRDLMGTVRQGIYTPRLVFWMMMIQRLQVGGTLARSVQQLVEGQFDSLLSSCKRVRERKIGLSTGGYCQARQRLPKLLVRRSVEQLIDHLQHRLLPADAPQVYLLDGTCLQLEPEAELRDAFPPASNQHGKAHWPVLRVVVLHNMETGLAVCPCWGAMNGPQAVSEQALAERALTQVPAGSVIVGDRNFGIFATAYAVHQRGLGVVVRLTAARARALRGGPLAPAGDYPVRWQASRWDGKKKRNWPADAAVPGRLIVWRLGRGRHSEWLYLFTTLTLPAAEVVALYGRRWNIETDLRCLKQTVRLQRIAAHSADMMEKELLLAVLAYNLVRSIMYQAAQRAGIAPRRLSFTYACNLVLDGYPRILAAPTAEQQLQELERLIDLVARCRLPNRTKRRSYPREVWGRGYRYPVKRREKN